MIKTTALSRLSHFFLVVVLLTGFLSTDAQAFQDPTKVDVVKVKKQHAYQVLSVPASVTAYNNSDLSFGVSGRLSSFNYDVGDSVNTDSTVAQLDKRQINANIASLKAQRKSLKATLQDEQQQLEELQTLAKTDFVAQSELRRARASVSVADANLAEVSARLNEREVNLDYHQLKSPFDAIITERLVDVGEWVTEEQPAFRVIQVNNMFVDAYIAQRFHSQVDESTEVSIESNKGSLNATVEAIVPYISENDRTFLLRLTPDEPKQLIVGSAVNAKIKLRSASAKLTVPQDAVIRYSDGRTSVWVVENDKDKQVAREKLVNLGQQFDGWVVIESSLTEEDLVIVRGNESLNDGETISLSQSKDYE